MITPHCEHAISTLHVRSLLTRITQIYVCLPELKPTYDWFAVFARQLKGPLDSRLAFRWADK